MSDLVDPADALRRRDRKRLLELVDQWRSEQEKLRSGEWTEEFYEQLLRDRIKALQKERAENPHNEASLRRKAGLEKKAVGFSGRFIDEIRKDARAAFEEGDGVDACPYRCGAIRRDWIEAYYEAEREP